MNSNYEIFPYLSIDTTLKSSLIIFRPNSIEKRKSNIIAYPNPAKNYFILDFTNLNSNFSKFLKAEVYTIDGKPVKIIKINTNFGFKVININTWTSGTYTILLKDENKLIGSSKIIKL